MYKIIVKNIKITIYKS